MAEPDSQGDGSVSAEEKTDTSTSVDAARICTKARTNAIEALPENPTEGDAPGNQLINIYRPLYGVSVTSTFVDD